MRIEAASPTKRSYHCPPLIDTIRTVIKGSLSITFAIVAVFCLHGESMAQCLQCDEFNTLCVETCPGGAASSETPFFYVPPHGTNHAFEDNPAVSPGDDVADALIDNIADAPFDIGVTDVVVDVPGEVEAMAHGTGAGHVLGHVLEEEARQAGSVWSAGYGAFVGELAGRFGSGLVSQRIPTDTQPEVWFTDWLRASVNPEVPSESSGDPVNNATGEFRIDEVDLALPGTGLSVAITRVYRSQWSFDGPMGHGWNHGYNQRLVAQDSACGVEEQLWVTGAGQVLRFAGDGPRLTSAPPSPYVLEDRRAGGQGWAVVAPDGVEFRFNDRGLLSSIVDLNENTIEVGWEESSRGDEEWRVARIIDTVGHELLFAYGVDGYLDKIQVEGMNPPMEVTYETDAFGDLVRVVGPAGVEERYVYTHRELDLDEPVWMTSTQAPAVCERACGLVGAGCEVRGGPCQLAATPGRQLCVDTCHQPEACKGECGANCSGFCHSEQCGNSCKVTMDDQCGDYARRSCHGLGAELCTPQCESRCEATCAQDNCEPEIDILIACIGDYEDQEIGEAEVQSCVPWTASTDTLASFGQLFAIGGSGVAEALYCFGSCVVDLVLYSNYDECWSNCDFSWTRAWARDFCHKDCEKCCIYGEACAPGVCARKTGPCAERCEQVFASGASSDFPECDPGPAGSCTEKVTDLCVRGSSDSTASCTRDCQQECTPACNDACDTACDDDSPCQDYCDDINYVRICEDSCLSTCIEEVSHPSGRRTWGHPIDLGHNIVEAYSGAEASPYLLNTYGSDPFAPDFDRVIAQQFGSAHITYEYFDLEQGQTPDVALPPEVEPAPQPVELCPQASACSVGGETTWERWIPLARDRYLVIEHRIPLGTTVGGPTTPPGDSPGTIGGTGDLWAVPSLAMPDGLQWAEFETAGTQGYISTSTSTSTGASTSTTPVFTQNSFEFTIADGSTVVATQDGATAVLSLSRRRPGTDELVDFAVEAGPALSLVQTDTGPKLVQGIVKGAVRLAGGGGCRGPFAAYRYGDESWVEPASACQGSFEVQPVGERLDSNGTRIAAATFLNPTGAPTLVSMGAGGLVYDENPDAAFDPGQLSLLNDPDLDGQLQRAERRAARRTRQSGLAVELAPARKRCRFTRGQWVLPTDLPTSPGPINPGCTPIIDPAQIVSTGGTVFDPSGPTGTISLGDGTVSIEPGCYDVGDPWSMGGNFIPGDGPADVEVALICEFSAPGPGDVNGDPTICRSESFNEPVEHFHGHPSQPMRFATLVTDDEGVRHTYYSDGAGQILRSVNHETGTQWDVNYDRFGRLKGTRSAFGDRTCMGYDEEWNVALGVRFPSPDRWSPQVQVRHKTEWGPHGRPRKFYDPRAFEPRVWQDQTWDALGNLVAVTTPDGARQAWTHDRRGRVTRATRPDGTYDTISYDGASGQWRKIHLGRGDAQDDRVWQAERDALGRPTELTRNDGLHVTLRWRLDGLLDQRAVQLDPSLGAVTEVMHYNTSGQLVGVSHPLHTVAYQYEERGLRTAQLIVPTPGGAEAARANCVGYDGRMEVVEIVGPDGVRTRIERDAAGRPLRAVAGVWPPSPEPWDDLCERYAPPTAAAHEEELGTWTWGETGELLGQSVGTLTSVHYAYDGFGRLLDTIRADGQRTRVVRDPIGMPTWIGALRAGAPEPTGVGELDSTDPILIAATRIEYDAMGRTSAVERPWFVDTEAGRQTLGPPLRSELHYFPTEGAIERVDPARVAVRTEFDGLGRPVLQTVPGQDDVRWEYSRQGRRVTTISPIPGANGTLIVNQDSLGGGLLEEVYNVAQPSLKDVKLTYDRFGRVLTQRTPEGARSMTWSPLGEVLEVDRLPLRGAGDSEPIASMRYDRAGRTQSMTDGNGHTTGWTWDALGRQVETTFPDGTTQHAEYVDGTGTPNHVTGRDGRTTDYLYDGVGRLTRASGRGPSGSGVVAAFVELLWDDTGLSEARSWRGSSDFVGTGSVDGLRLNYRRDSLGRVFEETLGRGLVTVPLSSWTAELDARGRLTHLSTPDAELGWTHDDLGRPLEVTVNGEEFAHIGWSGLGWPKQVTWSSGVTEDWTFDAHDRPVSVSTANAAGSVRTASWVWGRDGLMGRIDRTFGPSAPSGPRSSVFNVDSFGRLDNESHGLVGLPEMTSGSVRPQQLSRYRSQGTAWQALDFDTVDNWRSLQTPDLALDDINVGPDNRLLSFGATITSDDAGRVLNDGEGTRYVYDGLGHLSAAEVDGETWRFRTDAFGRLAAWEHGGAEVVQQHFGGSVLRQRVDGVGTTYVPGTSETPIGMVRGGERFGLHQGWGQRIEAVTDGDGALVERVTTSAFGQPSFAHANGTGLAGSGVGLGLVVSGQAYVPELGLHRFGARWYRLGWGRFLTPDPAGFVDGPNMYAYVGNQPLAFFDPSGLGKRCTKSNLECVADDVIPIVADMLSWSMGESEVNEYGKAHVSNLEFAGRIAIIRAAGGLYGAVNGSLEGVVVSSSLRGFLAGAVTGGTFGGYSTGLGDAFRGSWSSPETYVTAIVGSAVLGGAFGVIGGYGKGGRASVVGDAVAVEAPGAGVVSRGEGAATQVVADRVTYYRVQGGTGTSSSRFRVDIDAGGNVLFDGKTLNISRGGTAHARYFQGLRPGSKIYSFDVPKWFDDFVMEAAIPQGNYRANPANMKGNAPKIVDPHQPGSSVELPPVWSQWLGEYVIPGSGRISN